MPTAADHSVGCGERDVAVERRKGLHAAITTPLGPRPLPPRPDIERTTTRRAAPAVQWGLRGLQEDVMTTTAERPRRTRMADAELLTRTFEVAERQRGRPPERSDALQVRRLRSLARTCLGQCGLTYLTDDAVLILSELLTNAIQHSHGREITMSLALRNDHLVISVHNGVTGRWPIASESIASEPDADRENGRGLWLVSSIARQRHGRWGVSEKGDTTWCDLALEIDLITGLEERVPNPVPP